MSNQQPPLLHELESEIMEEAWERGEVTVHDVHAALNDRGSKTRAYTTVLTVMSRLDGKGMLRRRRVGRQDIYRPTMPRERYLEERAEAQVDALVAEYGDIALAQFARQMAQLDPKRRRRLRRLAGQ